VQSQLDRLAEWCLIDLQSQAAVLGGQQRGLVRFMAEEPAVTGIFFLNDDAQAANHRGNACDDCK
jgi:hypothetical protein